MIALQDAYYARLAATPAVVDELARIAGVPAIITESPVPPDTPTPYVVIREPVSDSPDAATSTKTTIGREVLTDIGIYDTRAGGSARCARIAEAVRGAIHNKPLAVEGFGNLVSRASGPIGAPVDNMHGRIVIGRTVLIEK